MDSVSNRTKIEVLAQMLTYPLTIHVLTLGLTPLADDDCEMQVRLKPVECKHIMDVIGLWETAGEHVCGDFNVGSEAAQEFVLRQVIVAFAAQNGLDISVNLQAQVDIAHASMDMLHQALSECLHGALEEDVSEDFIEEFAVLVDGIGRLAHIE
jgi:hypothetical protein